MDHITVSHIQSTDLPSAFTLPLQELREGLLREVLQVPGDRRQRLREARRPLRRRLRDTCGAPELLPEAHLVHGRHDASLQTYSQ